MIGIINNTFTHVDKKMDNIKKRQLMQEYFKKFCILFLPLELAGFCRFTMKNGRILERTFGSFVYNICALVVTNIGAGYLLFMAVFNKNYLSLPETITITHLTIYANLMILHITFGDKGQGFKLIQNCIEIDALLGTEETKFMRDIALNVSIILFIIVGIARITVVTYMYMVFEVSLAIHIVGSVYFGWMFFAYDDYCFFQFICVFITLRAHYLNVALMKIIKINPIYIPKQSIFNSLFWKDKYDEKITFHNSDGAKDFTVAFRMLFKQLRCVEDCYRFGISFGVLTMVLGSFVAVQALAMYLESPGLVLRAGAISIAIAVTWFYMYVLSVQIDMFYRQIEQTRLICAYTQLKPTSSDEMFKLTKSILRTLEVREARASLFGMFFFNTRLMLNIAASTFVYITVQLQVAFPSVRDAHKYDNTTISLVSDDPNIFKRFLV